MLVREEDDVIISDRSCSSTIQWVQMRVIIKQDRLINRTERSSDDATIVSGVDASSSSSSSDENGIFRATDSERERTARQATTFAQGRSKKMRQSIWFLWTGGWKEVLMDSVNTSNDEGATKLVSTHLDIKKGHQSATNLSHQSSNRSHEETDRDREQTRKKERQSEKFTATIMKHHGHHLKPHSS